MENILHIPSHLVSVVIQGPLYREFDPERGIHRCISSIRKYLPDAEIVVSTWEEEDVSDICGCSVIQSKAPPAFIDVAGNTINTNRQILSTQAGISASTRDFVLKFRADHFLTGDQITRIRQYPINTPENRRLFSNPITVTNLFIRNPVRVPMLFHLSDLVQFGRRNDMQSLWDTTLVTHSQLFHADGPQKNPFGNFIGFTNLKETPEQTITLAWLRKHVPEVKIAHVCQTNFRLLRLWETVLYENFLVLDWENSRVSFPKRFFNTGYSLRSIYKASEVIKAGRLAKSKFYFIRYLHVLTNQYIIGCFRPSWLVSTASLILFSISPSLAKAVRSLWRKYRKTQHLPSGRI